MNFNAQAGDFLPQKRMKKIKHVSDVNAVGPSIPTSQYVPPFGSNITQLPEQQQFSMPSAPSQSQYAGSTPLSGFNDEIQSQQQHYAYSQVSMQNQFQNYPNLQSTQHNQQQPMMTPLPHAGQGLNNAGPSGIGFSQQFAMLQQPIVQDMAIQYGQKLADQGKQLVENHFEKYVPVGKLKYYFAVDNKYVIKKLQLLFFPFAHKDWSLRYSQDNPVQPRHDINAVDLYIPSMAYITYVVLAGLMLGMQNRFTPEHLGIQASSALAYSIFEIVLYSITLYISNISTSLKTLDLLAFSGYKYVVINACILLSILFKNTGYYTTLLYCCLSLGFFLLRTLTTKVLNSTGQTSAADISYDSYGGSGPQTQHFDYSVGKKRKLYFLFLVVGFQCFLIFWLSKHLILS